MFCYVMNVPRKLLLLTVGYGEGHNTAARALAAVAEAKGWRVKVVDACAASSPRLFALTRHFYQFCVRSAPWMWAITYAQTETADWSTKATAPFLRKVTRYIQALLAEFQPDAVMCTYPLYGYMLDYLRSRGQTQVPYGMVVTDSLEISRPWMLTQADVVYLPDEYSLQLVHERYALPKAKLEALGFPVHPQFYGKTSSAELPTCNNMRIVYGAHAPLARVKADIEMLLRLLPGCCITLLAGGRYRALKSLASARVIVVKRTEKMVSLFENSHLYIGKAGAATVFEAYAMSLPIIINYALPGQEQGNLELLQIDQAGIAVSSTAELKAAVWRLINDGAIVWSRVKNVMISLNRSYGAERIINDFEHRFLYE